jgi:hypothetical protein
MKRRRSDNILQIADLDDYIMIEQDSFDNEGHEPHLTFEVHHIKSVCMDAAQGYTIARLLIGFIQ